MICSTLTPLDLHSVASQRLACKGAFLFESRSRDAHVRHRCVRGL